MTKPKATILIATHNGAATIEAAVESALAQETIFPFDVLVVDDGSADSTLDTVDSVRPSGKYARSIALSRHAGLYAAANKGIEFSQADFITRLDDDDILPPDALERLLPMLEKGLADWSYGDRLTVDPETGRASRVCVGYPMAKDWIPRLSACGVMMRRDILLHLGGYRDMFWHEYDLYLRYMAAARRPVHYVPRPVYIHAARPRGASGADAKMRDGWRELAAEWGEAKLLDMGFPVEREAAHDPS